MTESRAQLRRASLVGCEAVLGAIDNLDRACFTPFFPEAPVDESHEIEIRRRALAVRKTFAKLASPEVRQEFVRKRHALAQARAEFPVELERWATFVHAVIAAVHERLGSTARPELEHVQAKAAVLRFIHRSAASKHIQFSEIETAVLDLAVDVLVGAIHRVSRKAYDWQRSSAGLAMPDWTNAELDALIEDALASSDLSADVLSEILPQAHGTLTWFVDNRRELTGLVDALLVAIEVASEVSPSGNGTRKKAFAVELFLEFLADEGIIARSGFGHELTARAVAIAVDVLVVLNNRQQRMTRPADQDPPARPKEVRASTFNMLFVGALWFGAVTYVAAGSVLVFVGPRLVDLLALAAAPIVVRLFGLTMVALGGMCGLAAWAPAYYPAIVSLAGGLRLSSASLLVYAALVGEAPVTALFVSAAEYFLGGIHMAHFIHLQRRSPNGARRG